MKPKFVLPVFVLAACVLNAWVSAGVVLKVGSGTFAPNSGIQAIDVLVSSDASDNTLFLIADFQLAAGVFPVAAGTFGQPGMVGFGNIQDPPASQFVSAGNNSATLSLDFTNAQPIPAADTLIARMFIDTTGVAIGTYAIQVTSLSTQVGGSSVNGSFTISPVPEPSSLSLLGIAGLFALRRRKIWQRKSV